MTSTIDPVLTDKVQRDAYLRFAKDAAVEQVRFYRMCALSVVLGESYSQVAVDSSQRSTEAKGNKVVELTDPAHQRVVLADSWR